MHLSQFALRLPALHAVPPCFAASAFVRVRLTLLPRLSQDMQTRVVHEQHQIGSRAKCMYVCMYIWEPSEIKINN